MRSMVRNFAPLLLGGVLASPICMTGCAVHARVYDPYYHDYHAWNGEVVYYNQWEHDSHRSHVEFDKRNEADKKDYWDWRHSHH
jgi:hypothetical protein